MADRSHLIVWNVQRLFAPDGSGLARTLDFTRNRGWTSARYKKKVATVGAVLNSITGGNSPAILVLIEVENERVVADILEAAGWHGMVNITVDDEQVVGYDVAVVYNSSIFKEHQDAHSYIIDNRFSTRDILQATLVVRATGDELHIIATHWPSRQMSNSEPLRIGAAVYCNNLIESALKYLKDELFDGHGELHMPAVSTLTKRWSTPLLVAGDFNDNPFNDSVMLLGASTRNVDAVRQAPRIPTGSSARSLSAYLSRTPRLYNPTWRLLQAESAPSGTYFFDSDWHLLDQILLSAGMLDEPGPTFVSDSLHVYVTQTVELEDGTEVRVCTTGGRPLSYNQESGQGVSDHLPLIAELSW